MSHLLCPNCEGAAIVPVCSRGGAQIGTQCARCHAVLSPCEGPDCTETTTGEKYCSAACGRAWRGAAKRAARAAAKRDALGAVRGDAPKRAAEEK
jgi:hypothetical protein